MPANKLSQLNLVPNQRNQIGNQFCCVESFIGHLWEWEAIFTQDVFDVSNPRMLAYDQTLIIIDSVGCAFLRWQGEMKRVGERFVGGLLSYVSLLCGLHCSFPWVFCGMISSTSNHKAETG